MDNFIVSARKYRPATFDTVVGQHSITNTLKNAIRTNQLAQAFLFCGPRGVGKTTCARILAKTINCSDLSESLEPCGKCESCLSFSRSASFNIHELDAASNNSVDDIRNLVDQVRVPPQTGKYKVYIIDEVHMLSSAAFNAFLKTLEEPPPYAKFILATTEKHKIIPTILSRCQIYDFKRITIEDTVKYLGFVAEKEGIEADPDALHIIAQKSDGAMRDALSIFDQIVSFSGNTLTYKHVIENLNVLDYDYYFRITDSIIMGNYKETILIINEIFDNGYEGQHFLTGFGEHLRNLLVVQDHETIRLFEGSENLRNRYAEQASRVNASFLLKTLEITNNYDINYKISSSKKLHVEIALMLMCRVNTRPATEPVQDNKSQAVITKPVSPEPVVKVPAVKEPAINYGTDAVNKKPDNNTAKPGPVTTSIKSENNKPKEQDPEAKAQVSRQNEKFTPDQLKECINRYTGTLAPNTSYYTTLSKATVNIAEENKVVFRVKNKIESDNIDDDKTRMLLFLKKELKNDLIEIVQEIDETETGEKPYLPKDKFEAMKQKNPALDKLKTQFDLEIDF